MEKLVSIVVPVYNAEKYITNCINALQKQIYPNIEIILVDDGSRDKSLEICNMFAVNDKRIKVVHKENGGVSSARNTGIEMASGEYLMFADADDMAEPFWVKRMVELAEQWNVNLVICSYHKVQNYTEAKQSSGSIKAFEPVWATTREEFYEILGYMMTFRETMFCPWNKLFLMEIVTSQHIRFPEDVEYGEDFLFNLKYLEYCNGVIETKEKLYTYILQNPDSLEGKYKPDLYENQMKLYRAAKEFMIAHKVYHGFNVENLAFYCANRVIACVKNQFHRENSKSEWDRKQYIKSFFDNPDIRESVVIANLQGNQEQINFTELVKSKQYDMIYDTMLNGEIEDELFLDREATVRFKVLPERPGGLGWIPYTIKSVGEFGVVITVKRIFGKVIRKIRRK
ncbi:MAG: glycosyltransferase family 2 protein [Roseburia sp. 1XD42-69]|jgi:Glycosyltransferases involved in cell wall biogenesis